MNRIASDGTLQWLLGADNPPVRVLALVHLPGRAPEPSEVRDVGSHLMDYEVIREILVHGDDTRSAPSSPVSSHRC